MSPHALRQRMKHGNVYPPDRAKVALERFFTEANLTALRELSLRLVARTVEGKLEDTTAGRRLPLVSERVLVLVDGSAASHARHPPGRDAGRGHCTPRSSHVVVTTPEVERHGFDRRRDLREADRRRGRPGSGSRPGRGPRRGHGARGGHSGQARHPPRPAAPPPRRPEGDASSARLSISSSSGRRTSSSTSSARRPPHRAPRLPEPTTWIGGWNDHGQCGAEAGTRTRTGLPPAVFETAASAIPPLRPG